MGTTGDRRFREGHWGIGLSNLGNKGQGHNSTTPMDFRDKLIIYLARK